MWRGWWRSLMVTVLLLAGCTGASPELSDDAGTGVAAAATSPSNSGAATPLADDPQSAVPPDTAPAEEAPANPVDESADDVSIARWQSDIADAPPLPDDWADPLASDDAAIETELANGLRVIVRRNTAPGSQAQLRLVVGAGSLNDDPDHLGSAHFLEHMMFNGTERFPGNTLVPVLEGFGSAFGPDVNAYTSYGETVYELTVPARDSDTVELGLDVLAQWAASATIDPDAVVAERGIVREEWRRRAESVGGRITTELRSVLLADSTRLGRQPIGVIEHIDRMAAPELRAFYETWYRPDNMAVIVVGDIDPDDMLDAIADRFGPLDNPATALGAGAPDRAQGGLPSAVFDRWSDPELARTDVEIRWRVPATTVKTPADVHAELVVDVAMTALDLRLFESIERGESVAVNGGFRRSGLTPATDLVIVRGEVAPGDATAFVDEAITIAESVRQHGLADDEFSGIIERFRSGIEQSHAVSSSIQDTALASRYIDYVLRESPVGDPDDERDIAIEALERITIDDVRRAIDVVLESNPYVLVAGPSGAENDMPDGVALEQAYRRALGALVDRPQGVSGGPAALMAAPDPADEIDRRRIDEFGATVATFANGVQVAVRETGIVDNLIVFQAWSRGGFFQEAGAVAPLLGRAAGLVMPSGFGSVDAVELDRLLGGKVASLNADVGRATEVLAGESSTDDLETLMQLIHLQMTDATITPVSVRRFEEGWRPIVDDPSIRPALAADLELWSMRYGDSPYFRLLPTADDLDSLDPAVQLDAWNRRFADADDFVWVFVGDLDPDDVFDLASRYLATLPSQPGGDSAIDRDPGLPDENLVSTVEAGVGDLGRLRINWESPYPFTLEAEVEAEIVELVVDARLRDVVREELGASYSPTAAVTVLSEPKPWVDTIIELDTDPDRIAEVSATIREELERIRAGDIDAGYLERAVDQLLEEQRFFSNQEWIGLIVFHLANPDRPADEYRNRGDLAASLTVADIAEAATTIFPPQRSVEVRLVPAGDS